MLCHICFYRKIVLLKNYKRDFEKKKRNNSKCHSQRVARLERKHYNTREPRELENSDFNQT